MPSKGNQKTSVYSAHDHGYMIAHRVQDGAYHQALEKVVRPGAMVVDIGTGTGLFAILHAVSLGARKVFAIESGEIYELARPIRQDDGCTDRIEFLAIFLPAFGFPERADVSWSLTFPAGSRSPGAPGR